MAKGNLFLGYARGKVGSLVFARRKGEQITRARNVAPSNPRTQAQMAQRMKMFAPVQLYKQSLRHFFKYAFPLKANETIFNAFMRENITLAPWVAKPLSVAQAPIPFPARMSSGGLVGVVTSVDAVSAIDADSLHAAIHQSGQRVMLSMRSSAVASNLTVGALSTAILAENHNLAQGDMLTFVLCHTPGLSITGNRVAYDGFSPFTFRYLKLTLDTTSDVLVSDLGFVVAPVSGSGSSFSMAINAELDEHAIGGCVIITRTVGSSVIASNSVLVLNEFANDVYTLMRSESYRAIAAASYNAQEDAFLKPASVDAIVSDNTGGGSDDGGNDDGGNDDGGNDDGGNDGDDNTGGGNGGSSQVPPEPEQPEQIFIGTSVNDSRMGSVTGMGTYDYGTTVTLRATANAGYRFVSWGDDVTENPRVIKAEVNGVTYSAIFEAVS